MGKDRAIARFDRKVKGALRESGVTAGDLLVVAVSGGPDSLSLLYALSHLRRDMALKLHGAHLDHGLRGAASRQDAAFVADTCRGLGIGFSAEAVEGLAFRKQSRQSLEEAAREARYEFLAHVAVEEDAKAIVLGHTADDQAETVLMNIIRGSGLTGLRGMEPSTRRTISGSEALLLRPLLAISKQETRDYCVALELQPRLDESNLSKEPRRNRVRLELIPILEHLNPAVREALIRLSWNAARCLTHLDREVDAVWPDAVRRERDHVALTRGVFLGLDAAIQGHLLRRAIAEVNGDLNSVDQGHIDDMARLMAGPAGRTLDLPGGLRFSADYAEATIAPTRLDLCPLPPIEGEHELSVPGDTLVGGWRVTARLMDRDEWNPSAQPQNTQDGGSPGASPEPGPGGFVAHLSCDSVGRRPYVRARRPGDRFQPLGMPGHKKLQDFMVDEKIPRAWRDRVPLVVSGRGIAWVAGWRIAEWAKVTHMDGKVLELRFVPEGAFS